MKEILETTLGRMVFWSLILVTVAVTPLWSLDPINPIKMLLLSAFGFAIFAVLLASRQIVEWHRFKSSLILLAFFVLWQVAVTIFSGADVVQQVFGDIGRNTGLVTYVGLAAILLAAMISASSQSVKTFYKAALIVGFASIAYGLIQASGNDPFDWVNPYSPVFGFLGNPNFQSSLLGVLGSLAFAQTLNGNIERLHKVVFAGYLVLTIVVINETVSQQGFLVLVVGISVVLGVYVKSRFHKLVAIMYGVLAGIGFLAVLTGSLNKGPLAGLLYKDSVTFRGDYWGAGWKMTLDHPIFGVGLDSYGDWYRRSRSIEATLRRGPDVVTNAAHNVYLDMSSFGGFPLLIAYSSLMIVVAISSWKVIKRAKEFNAPFAGLVGAWLAFQAQSIISINQIGLAIWGWVLSGLIVGYEIKTRDLELAETKKKQLKHAVRGAQSSPLTLVALFLGLSLGILAGMPPYLASAKYKGALQTGNPNLIQDAAYIWPLEPSRISQVAATLNDNNLAAQGLEVALFGVKEFADTYGAWVTLYEMKEASDEQKAQALRQMKRLDPLNPNLK